jgi:hypothetical protein
LVLFAICFAMLGGRAGADPGMTWTQEHAWLITNGFVYWQTIAKAYDKSVGVTVGTATIRGAHAQWIIHAVLDKNDVVTEETYTIAKGGETPSLQWGNRGAQILIRRMYAGTTIADEYLNGSLVASVPIYNDSGKEDFYAVKGGKFGFMLDPYEVVIFRNSELGIRIKQARYCSTHKECG